MAARFRCVPSVVGEGLAAFVPSLGCGRDVRQTLCGCAHELAKIFFGEPVVADERRANHPVAALQVESVEPALGSALNPSCRGHRIRNVKPAGDRDARVKRDAGNGVCA